MNVYESVLKNSNILMFIVNSEGIITEVNRYTDGLFGAGIEGKYFYSLIDGRSQVRIQSIIRQRESKVIEAELKEIYGPAHHALLNISIMDDLLFIIGVVNDRDESGAQSGQIYVNETGEELQYEDKRQWQLKNIDPVTGLYNKQFFELIFQSLNNKAVNGRGNVGIICFDIAGFEDVLNNYGQNKVNSMLMGFAQVILTSIRSTDYAARYDDKFLVLIPDTSRGALKGISERIKDKAKKSLDISLNARWIYSMGEDIKESSQIAKFVYEKIDELEGNT